MRGGMGWRAVHRAMRWGMEYHRSLRGMLNASDAYNMTASCKPMLLLKFGSKPWPFIR